MHCAKKIKTPDLGLVACRRTDLHTHCDVGGLNPCGDSAVTYCSFQTKKGKCGMTICAAHAGDGADPICPPHQRLVARSKRAA